MIDLEQHLTESLAAVAADRDDVHVERLLAGARSTGLRYRRHRQLLGTGSAVLAGLAVTALVAGGVALAGTGNRGTRTAAPAVTVAPSGTGGPVPSLSARTFTVVPALPAAPGAPSLLAAPGTLGQPPLLHLTLDRLPYPAAGMQWTVLDRFERLYVTGGVDVQGGAAGPTFSVVLARSTNDLDPLDGNRSSVTIGGHAGTLATTSLQGQPYSNVRWQPVAGVWAQVSGVLDAPSAVATAAAVRLDRTWRCAVPFHITGAPAGATLGGCSTGILAGDSINSLTVMITDSDITIDVQSGQVTSPNATLGGRDAQILEHPGDGGQKIMEILVALGDGRVVSLTAAGTYDAATVRDLAAHVAPAAGTDPASWPTDPLS
jgi:hypothetical protein